MSKALKNFITIRCAVLHPKIRKLVTGLSWARKSHAQLGHPWAQATATGEKQRNW